MIRELLVENVAVIAQASIEFEDGFTALTGETGAGKSLVIDSINLALGGRADRELVRNGATKAVVSLRYDLRGNPDAIRQLVEAGFDAPDGEIVILREVSSNGNSSARINGRPCTNAMLREMCNQLVDMHGQHDHQALLNPGQQLDFLDAWIGETALRARQLVAEAVTALRSAQSQLSRLTSTQRQREQRLDIIRFQLQEIESAEVKVGEYDSLKSKLHTLQNSEKTRQSISRVVSLSQESDENLLDRLRICQRELASSANIDPAIKPYDEMIANAVIQVSEAVSGLADYLEKLDGSAEEMDRVATRIDLLSKLFRKYGEDESAILSHASTIAAELSELESGEEGEAELRAKVEKLQAELNQQAQALSDIRKKSISEFEKTVVDHLVDLNLAKAEFYVDQKVKPCDETGMDEIGFLFSANPGEPLRPLDKVASGGELSRVMLSIKVASAGRAGVPILIFDEVDAGLSGRAAAAVAKKIEQLAVHRQVIVISHLPQVASRATSHFLIEKAEVEDRVETYVRKVSGEQRVAEIARMLAGEVVGERAIENARELLAR